MFRIASGKEVPLAPERWHPVRVEWNGSLRRVLVDGEAIWSVEAPYPCAPVEHRVWIGSAPGQHRKYVAQVPGLTFRNVKIVALR